MLTYIDPFYFFLALFIGMFFVYISTPLPDIIIKYPTPDKIDELIYQDDSDTCYKYNAKEVSCPLDKSKIKHFDIQVVNNDKKNNQNFLNIVKDKLGI